ncbi:DUF386 domain-containing protein [bacterium]|nr:DUF386 domain-containing protein [bacterium]
MIIDNLKNISKYKDIPIEVVTFIESIDSTIKCGKHIISDDVYANVEEYTTKIIDNGKFESHRNYIDIQLLLSGMERIYVREVQGLNTEIPYSLERDIEFYSDNIANSDFVTLNGNNFVMLYPHEAHAPQIALDELSTKVLKVVVKVKVN